MNRFVIGFFCLICLGCGSELLHGHVHLYDQFSAGCKAPICCIFLLGNSWRYSLVKNYSIWGLSLDRNSARKGEHGLLHHKKDVQKFVSALALDERLLLEYFFRCLIQEDSIGYVLLGGKPMGFFSYIGPKVTLPLFQSDPLTEIDLFFEGFDDRNALFEKGLEIWKKYEHLFCGRNIFFDVFEQDLELHYKKVIVINKRLVLPLLIRHFHKFKDLDPSIDKSSVFEYFLSNPRLKKKFYSQQDLLGTCLGYGERNAALFQKMFTLLKSLGRLGFTLDLPSSNRRQRLEKEWADLKQSFVIGFRDHESRKLLFHHGVGFRADFSDPETILLMKKYAEFHKKLTQMYEGANFLTKTLELIIEGDQ